MASGGSWSKEQAELHEQALAAMRQLATEVGEAAQLCDALAGSLRQYVPAEGRAQAPAALECSLAAVEVIPKLKVIGLAWLSCPLCAMLSCLLGSCPDLCPSQMVQGRTFPARGFPASFILQLGHFFADGSEASARSLAVQVLRVVLQAVQEGGSPAPLDKRTAASVLSVARSLSASNSASELDCASRLSALVGPVGSLESSRPSEDSGPAISPSDVHVQQLPELVEAASWGFRRGSLRRDDVNLERVLELLEGNQDDAANADVGCTGAPAERARGAAAPRASIKEVLEMVARLPPASAAGPVHVDMGALSRQLQPAA